MCGSRGRTSAHVKPLRACEISPEEELMVSYEGSELRRPQDLPERADPWLHRISALHCDYCLQGEQSAGATALHEKNQIHRDLCQ